MRQIFRKNYFSRLRFIFLVFILLLVIVTDSFLKLSTFIHYHVDKIVSPFYFFINNSCQIFNNFSKVLTDKINLEKENQNLKKELLVKNSNQLLLEYYKQDNIRLRKLLSSPLSKKEKKMVARIISFSNNPFNNQIIIDKGIEDGVYIGQPVLNEHGIIGQVIMTNKFTSRILLIYDISHALQIQVLRNDIRAIAIGNGKNKNLKLSNIPNNIDIRTGDILVTSGLDGCFPEGYPVAIVSFVKFDTSKSYATIYAEPTAFPQNSHYLLLIWNKSNFIRSNLYVLYVKSLNKNFLYRRYNFLF